MTGKRRPCGAPGCCLSPCSESEGGGVGTPRQTDERPGLLTDSMRQAGRAASLPSRLPTIMLRKRSVYQPCASRRGEMVTAAPSAPLPAALPVWMLSAPPRRGPPGGGKAAPSAVIPAPRPGPASNLDPPRAVAAAARVLVRARGGRRTRGPSLLCPPRESLSAFLRVPPERRPVDLLLRACGGQSVGPRSSAF